MFFSKGLRVVIINGKPTSGKTAFESICEDIIGPAYCEQRSTVDKVKELATMAGWDGTKDLTSRKMLSDLKDLFTKYNNMPMNDIIQYLKGWEADLAYYNVSDHPHILFVDDREPEHIQQLAEILGGITLLIRRPGDEELETSNHADANVFNFEYDYVIQNDGTLEDLREKAEEFINWLFN